MIEAMNYTKEFAEWNATELKEWLQIYYAYHNALVEILVNSTDTAMNITD